VSSVAYDQAVCPVPPDFAWVLVKKTCLPALAMTGFNKLTNKNSLRCVVLVAGVGTVTTATEMVIHKILKQFIEEEATYSLAGRSLEIFLSATVLTWLTSWMLQIDSPANVKCYQGMEVFLLSQFLIVETILYFSLGPSS